MADVVFLGLSHWHVPMHVAAARRLGLTVSGWDGDPGIAQAWSQREGARCHATISDALAARSLLAVVTGTPLEMAPRVMAAAAAGIPVLVEKPVAPGAAALRPVVERARAMGAWIAVALPHHAGPLASASQGHARHLSVRLMNGRPGRYRDWGSPWMLDPAVGGGGALRNLGVHGIDLACTLLGPGLTVNHARLAYWHGEAVEDHAVVHLLSPDGASATVEAGYLHPDDAGSDFEARLVTRDALLIDTGEALVRHAADGSPERLPVTPQPRRYDDLMADVVARLRDGRAPAADLGDLLEAMALIDAAYAVAGRA